MNPLTIVPLSIVTSTALAPDAIATPSTIAAATRAHVSRVPIKSMILHPENKAISRRLWSDATPAPRKKACNLRAMINQKWECGISPTKKRHLAEIAQRGFAVSAKRIAEAVKLFRIYLETVSWFFGNCFRPWICGNTADDAPLTAFLSCGEAPSGETFSALRR